MTEQTRIEVTRDTSRREIQFEIKQGRVPDLDVTESWHRNPKFVRPTRGELVLVDGEVRRITVQGGLVRKNGEASELVLIRREWRSTTGSHLEKQRIENAPEWVRHIWKEAAHGVTSWTYADDRFTGLTLGEGSQ
jgi:hypothetical protein